MIGQQRIRGYVSLSVAMILVGSTVTASKIIGVGMPPFTATLLRFTIATPIFAAISAWKKVAFPRRPTRDWVVLIVQAGSGSVAYTVFLILGTRLTSAANAGIVLGTLPAVMGILSFVWFRERLSGRLVIAIGLAALGVLTVSGVRSDVSGFTLAMEDAAGILLVAAAVVCESLFLLLNRKLTAPLPPLTLSFLMSGIGFCLALIPAIVEIATGRASGAHGASIAGAVYYALVPTVGGFTLWYFGSARTSAGESALLTTIMPVSAVVIAAVVLRESVTTVQIVGILCVLAALAVGTTRRRSDRSS